MTHIFISYSRSDKDFAQKLADTLTDGGVEVFLDVQGIEAGEKWSTAIQRALDAADVMLLIVSPTSMESVNVEDEWQYFLDSKKPIIPLLWLPAKLHFQLNRMQYVNFNGVPFDAAIKGLFAELGKKGVLVKSAPPEPPAKRASVEFARLPHAIEPNAKLNKSDELFGGPAALPTTKAIKKGEAVVIFGRTPNAEWLHLKTAGGQQGWLPRGVIGLMVDINTIPITAENPPEQQVDFIVPRRLLYGLITVALVVVIGTALYFSGLLPDGKDEDNKTATPNSAWIDLQLPEAPLSDTVEIRGTANAPEMAYYRIVAMFRDRGYRDTVFEGRIPTTNGLLASWDTFEYNDGNYDLVLQLYDERGLILEQTQVATVVDNREVTRLGTDDPAEGDTIYGEWVIRGSATVPNFASHHLEVAPDPNPDGTWTPVTEPVDYPMVNGVLGVWDTTQFPDGLYQLRVVATDVNDQWFAATSGNIRVQNTPD